MKFVYLLLFSVAITVSSTAQSGKELTNKKTSSMMPIVEGLYNTIATLEKENVEIIRIEFDNIVDKKSLIRKLTENYTYGVMVYGDYRIKKIDIRILIKQKKGWKLLESGENNGTSSIVHIEPKKTADYKIEIEITEFAKGYTSGHYGLIIIHN